MNREPTILIIDDEESLRTTCRAVLEASGFRVIEASDGEMGLDRSRDITPDLVLCDIEMPRKNGYQVLSMFRSTPRTAAIPFVFLTGRSGQDAMRKGMDLGADDYLTKPFTAESLLAAVRTRLQKAGIHRKEIGDRMEELRSAISAAVPHELRTPLTGILGFAAALREQAGSLSRQEQSEIADHILHSGRRLQKTLEKFWLYSELAMSARKVERPGATEPLDGVAIVIKVVAKQLSESLGRGNDLVLMLDQQVRLRIGEKHLTILVSELLENAFKFSSPGQAVEVKLMSAGHHVDLAVKDAGKGMTQAQITEVGGFMQFGRKQQEQQGLGLGLAIVKEIAGMYGGTMTVTSEIGTGTTVTARFSV